MNSDKYNIANQTFAKLIDLNIEKSIKLNEKITPERMATQAILKAYHEIDKVLFESHNSNDEYSHGFKKVYIKINGKDVILRRRYYRDNRTKKYIFLLDDFIGLPSRKEISYEFIIKNFQKIIEARSYKQASTNFLQHLDPRLISEAISKVKFEIKRNSLTKQTDKLFIALDGQWFGAKGKKGRKNEFKFAVSWTGTKQISKNRNKLINRQIICLNKMKDVVSIASYVETFIQEVYGKVGKVIIIGDGASWISNLARELQYDTTRVIDKYHFEKMVKDLYKKIHGQKSRVQFPDVLNINKKQFNIWLLSCVSDDDGVIELDENQKKLFNKIIKWFPKYKKNIEYGDAINPIECIQAHYFAKYFRGYRVFKLKNLYKYINLQCAYLNNWEIKFGASSNSSWMGWDSEYLNWDEPPDDILINYEIKNYHGIRSSSMQIENPEGFGFGGRN